MAIAAATVWEVRTTGDNLNGGGYKSGGTDYSQQDTAQLSVADGSSSSTTNLNSATGGFTSAMVGNIAQISGGTLTAGFYEIVAYVDPNNVTLDRALNTGSGSTVKVGGALLTLDKVDDGMVAGNTCYIKSGTYTRTTTWTNTLASASSATRYNFVGYDSTRSLYNTDSTRPLITTATNSVQLITTNNADWLIFRNLSFSNTAGTRAVCYGNTSTATSAVVFDRCLFDGFTFAVDMGTNIANLIEPLLMLDCEVKNCTTGGARRMRVAGHYAFRFIGCYFHDNTGAAISAGNGADAGVLYAENCIFDTNTRGCHILSTSGAASGLFVKGCTFYNNTTSAIESDASSGNCGGGIEIMNNIIYGGVDGINFVAGNETAGRMIQRNNAYGGQSGSARVNFTAGESEIDAIADPFTDPTNGDFSLDTSGKTELSALAYPTAYPGGLTDNYRDIGAAQHQDTGGGGATPTSHVFIG